jgi:hypothetical protein
MVLLSFSVKEEELKTRSKTHTTRPFSPERFKQLWDAEQFEIWWKSRTKGGYKLYDAIQDGKPYLIEFNFYVQNCGARFFIMKNTVESFSDKGPLISNRVMMSDKEFNEVAVRDGFEDGVHFVMHFISVYGMDTFSKMFIGVPFKEKVVQEQPPDLLGTEGTD